MYFSVITPQDGCLRQAAHMMAFGENLGEPYVEHQWLWRFFPGEKKQVRDFVFRRYDTDQTPRFYVVSQRRPIAFDAVWQVQSQDYAPQLEQGMRLAFELRANPVRAEQIGARKHRLHDVVMDAKRKLLAARGIATWAAWDEKDGKPALYEVVAQSCGAWLQDVGARKGFALALNQDDARTPVLRVDAYEQKKTGKPKDDAAIQFSTVDFSGELVVSDVKAFSDALYHGIGRSRAFGCGLMLVKRAGG